MREIRNPELISEGRPDTGDEETRDQETDSEEVDTKEVDSEETESEESEREKTGGDETGDDETGRESTGEEEEATSADPSARAEPNTSSEKDGPSDPDRTDTESTDTESTDTEPAAPGPAAPGQAGTTQPGPGSESSEIKHLLTEAGHKEVGNLQKETGSVRTTFRLGVKAEGLFERLSERTGTSQKALLGSALRLCSEAWEGRPSRFEEEARALQVETTFQKPMAIAPAVREGLNELCEEIGIARDRLVEVGIRLTREALEEQARRKLLPHRDILEDLRALWGEVESVQRALSTHENRTGPGSPPPSYEDPVESALFDILYKLKTMREAVEEELETGEPMGGHRTFP